MPSIVTHHIFAKEVAKKQNWESKLSFPHYLIFAQSFDNLFYYQFLTPWKGKEIREFGEEAQTKNINLYFKNIIEYIKENHLEQNKELLSYLYGSLCHYKLDEHCHPFVIYHSGIPKINKKYRGLHEKMEVNLDAYMYELKEGKKLYKQSLANTLLPKVKFSQELIKGLDETFIKTFQKENMGIIYEKSVKTGNLLLKYGVTDKTGIKKQIYKIKDTILPHKKRKYEYLSFHVTNIDPIYQNKEHHVWHHPVTNKPSTKSFEDLYNDALKEVRVLINTIELYWQEKVTMSNVLEKIGNNSYTTGLPCEEKKPFQYFKI